MSETRTDEFQIQNVQLPFLAFDTLQAAHLSPGKQHTALIMQQGADLRRENHILSNRFATD